MRPETQRSPAPELLKLLVGSMSCGGSEKSLRAAPARFVRSVQAPPTLGSDAAWAAAAAYAFGSIAPLGASRCDVNQAAAAAAAWLSSPAVLCEELGEPLPARAGTAMKTTTVIAAKMKASRRISTPLQICTLLRAMGQPRRILARTVL